MFPYKSYPFFHGIISFLRDKDVKGIRALSVLLPKLLLPAAEKSSAYILKTLHGFYLKIDPSKDKGVELSLHETGTYEKGILSYLKSVLQKGDSFIDVGANIGLISIHTAKLVGQKGTVFSYEAMPATAALLRENIALNQLKNIVVGDFALGSVDGKTEIFENWQVNRGGASLLVKTEQSASFEIDVFCLDSVFPKEFHPKVVKIDVEGFEMEVLKGAKNLIQREHPILIIEFSEKRENTHDSAAEMADFIRSLGKYRFFKLKGGKERKSKLVEITTEDEFPAHDNVICIENTRN